MLVIKLLPSHEVERIGVLLQHELRNLLLDAFRAELFLNLPQAPLDRGYFVKPLQLPLLGPLEDHIDFVLTIPDLGGRRVASLTLVARNHIKHLFEFLNVSFKLLMLCVLFEVDLGSPH